MSTIFEQLSSFLPNLKENVSLKEYSTFKIGGIARYFLIPENEAQLKIAIQKALDLKINFSILGGGSNTLINSQGFDGLVIVYKNQPRLEDFVPIKTDEYFFVEASADWPLFFLTEQAKISGLSGMEWAIGIPGTIGGAINGNAGAFGTAIGDAILGVQVLEIKNGFVSEKFFTPEDCIFMYRSSVFKNNPNLIILSARIKLEKKELEEIKKKMEDNIEHRKNKHPKGFSVGSIFKNYDAAVSSDIINKYPELDGYLSKGAIPAGYLIDQCGLLGATIGGAKVSSEHGNFIINANNASSDDVIRLIAMMKKEVENKFGIKLEEEIKII